MEKPEVQEENKNCPEYLKFGKLSSASRRSGNICLITGAVVIFVGLCSGLVSTQYYKYNTQSPEDWGHIIAWIRMIFPVLAIIGGIVCCILSKSNYRSADKYADEMIVVRDLTTAERLANSLGNIEEGKEEQGTKGNVESNSSNPASNPIENSSKCNIVSNNKCTTTSNKAKIEATKDIIATLLSRCSAE